jgi:hypothetical protein
MVAGGMKEVVSMGNALIGDNPSSHGVSTASGVPPARRVAVVGMVGCGFAHGRCKEQAVDRGPRLWILDFSLFRLLFLLVLLFLFLSSLWSDRTSCSLWWYSRQDSSPCQKCTYGGRVVSGTSDELGSLKCCIT